MKKKIFKYKDVNINPVVFRDAAKIFIDEFYEIDRHGTCFAIQMAALDHEFKYPHSNSALYNSLFADMFRPSGKTQADYWWININSVVGMKWEDYPDYEARIMALLLCYWICKDGGL